MRTQNISRCILISATLVPLTCIAQETDFPSGMFAELPHERAELYEDFGGVGFPVTTSDNTAAKFFQQGLAQLYAGTRYEAARAFREVITRDPKCAMGYWGIAMAFQSDASLATEYMWKAYQQRGGASKCERQFIESYAKYYGAEMEPEMLLVDVETGKRRAKPVERSKKDETAAAIELRSAIERQNADSDNVQFRIRGDIFQPRTAHSFYDKRKTWSDALRYRRFPHTWSALAQSFKGDPAARDTLLASEARVRFDNKWLASHDAMPYECPGYAERWAKLVGASMETKDVLTGLKSLPKHPALPTPGSLLTQRAEPDWREKVTATREELQAIESLGPLQWTPPTAPAFALSKGSGQGILTSQDLKQPTIVVFYLGFGCIHCVEQLNELRPRYKDFKEAGIEIIAIGSDSVNDVKAAMLDSVEVDDPHTPFEILCDPKHDVFKQFHCWDEFSDEPLHGTFLIDTKGRIRWRDISEEPFMETDFLLEESQRLLAQ
ncbi:MAG: peroxiredoxin family protein [Planctomycetaceae bacterium]